MYADLDRLAQGGNHTDTAADHARGARTLLESVEVSSGMFGRTETAANAEAVVSRTHAQHVRVLKDHHRTLTRIGENTTNATTALHGADQAGADTVRAVDTLDRRG